MLLLWLLIINTLDDLIARNIQGGRKGKMRASFNAQALDFSRLTTEIDSEVAGDCCLRYNIDTCLVGLRFFMMRR